MTHFSTRTFFATAALIALTTSAFAQSARPWELKTDMGYAYGKDGKTWSYKMGTNNAGTLLKGAKKVPKGTLFFIGQNGQLYMRSGPYLESDGKFMFGSE
ncbi:hypothetical protein MTX26_05370 [Bradyrhizobium sp. ISRA443]|uniref:hypothetical protein n=1 Tax=unclassified Bradyrhizobium TaxID=2631580 RepID=UPI00247AEB95|nr:MULTISPECIES: hypothetical protein [unclassified Bradyrhizobium]WGS00284.1 hypothetical protein MTX23_05370 [Bradyrhizobium sp. ISRA436]WGS07173.1 hypothetical protein MTX18_05370 [Bradyrhizobium sp. ISRA437]WGS14058.1 hypothetical protein MTX26_05370 [Bradyrhizobium sp. ISRA443]